MKNILKRISLVLLVLIVAEAFAACGNGASEVSTPAENSTAAPSATEEISSGEETEYAPNLPDVRFDGYEFCVLQRAQNVSYYGERFIDAPEIIGDSINDEVYSRNRALEEKYGITIKTVEAGDKAETTAAFETSVNNGEKNYSLMIAQTMAMATLVSKGMFYNIKNMPNADFNASYWQKNSLDGYEIKGRNYLFMNDISYTALHYTRGIVFNTFLVEEYKVNNPYDLVNNNTWTLETFLTEAGKISDDLNGDNVFDSNDRFGLITETGIIDFLLAGADIPISGLDADGNRFLTMVDDATLFEKTLDVMERYNDYLQDSTKSLSYESAQKTESYSGGQWAGGRKLFAEDHFLFLVAGAYSFDELAGFGMTHEYGIVPIPKYTADQEKYYTRHDSYGNIFAIPAYDADNIDTISVIMEYWAYLSEKTVKPVYYDLHVKTKRAYGVQFGQMMDLLKNAVNYEFTEAYGVGVMSIIHDCVSSSNPSSLLKSTMKPLKKNLENFNDTIAQLD